jgi:hypothetical protein
MATPVTTATVLLIAATGDLSAGAVSTVVVEAAGLAAHAGITKTVSNPNTKQTVETRFMTPTPSPSRSLRQGLRGSGFFRFVNQSDGGAPPVEGGEVAQRILTAHLRHVA